MAPLGDAVHRSSRSCLHHMDDPNPFQRRTGIGYPANNRHSAHRELHDGGQGAGAQDFCWKDSSDLSGPALRCFDRARRPERSGRGIHHACLFTSAGTIQHRCKAQHDPCRWRRWYGRSIQYATGRHRLCDRGTLTFLRAAYIRTDTDRRCRFRCDGNRAVGKLHLFRPCRR